jgi:uncharacterized protein (DUF1501 family)
MRDIGRRDFLRASLAGLGWSAVSPLARAARAGGGSERVLVVLELRGGNDGLNTLVPLRDPEYPRLRPTLALARRNLIALDDECGLHPNLEALAPVWERGELALVRGVGLPRIERSHFHAIDMWYRADPDLRRRSGWLGRLADRAGTAGAPPSISATREPAEVLEGRRTRGAAVGAARELTLDLGPRERELLRACAAAPEPRAAGPSLHAEVSAALRTSELLAARVDPGAATDGGAAADGLAGRLELVRECLRAGLGTRVFFVVQEGYDTHSTQAYRHALLLQELSGAVAGFLDDLRSDGLEREVLVMAFSEFGRRAAENASQGTDHGSGGLVLLAGADVRGGLHGEPPVLDDLVEGDLRCTTDYRRVYADVVAAMGASPRELLGAEHAPLGLVRA